MHHDYFGLPFYTHRATLKGIEQGARTRLAKPSTTATATSATTGETALILLLSLACYDHYCHDYKCY